MANINPAGIDTSSGQQKQLTSSDQLVDSSGTPLITVTTNRLAKRQIAKSSSVSANIGAATVQSVTTVPTTSTGTQVLSFSYTPVRVGNIVKVTAQILVGINSARDIIGSVFQGSTNIGGTADRTQGGGSGFTTLMVLGDFTVSSLSSVTISSRIALDTTTGSFYINGNQSGTTALFTANKCYLIAEEYDPS